jgi:hypothetical protein
MAICRFCESEMHTADGCTEAPIMMADGVIYAPVRYGQEIDWGRPKGRCGDCRVLPGRVHHHGCDIEECPRCHRQGITCGCVWRGEEHLADDWDEEWEERLLR